VVISIKDFADKVTIGGNPFMLVYVRVAVTNNGSAAVTVPPGGSGPNLIRLTSTSLDTVQPGQTSNNDFVVAVDNFGTGAALPAGSALSSAAPSLDSAYSAMTSYWNGRVAETASFQLPNLTLPNTGNLANPGTALSNAYKAGTIYMLIMQVGEAQFPAANNYAWILNHDVPGELQARFDTGNFRDAQNLLLTARISETTNSALGLWLWLWRGWPLERQPRGRRGRRLFQHDGQPGQWPVRRRIHLQHPGRTADGAVDLQRRQQPELRLHPRLGDHVHDQPAGRRGLPGRLGRVHRRQRPGDPVAVQRAGQPEVQRDRLGPLPDRRQPLRQVRRPG
jgi:hypothetical protein